MVSNIDTEESVIWQILSGHIAGNVKPACCVHDLLLRHDKWPLLRVQAWSWIRQRWSWSSNPETETPPAISRKRVEPFWRYINMTMFAWLALRCFWDVQADATYPFENPWTVTTPCKWLLFPTAEIARWKQAHDCTLLLAPVIMSQTVFWFWSPLDSATSDVRWLMSDRPLGFLSRPRYGVASYHPVTIVSFVLNLVSQYEFNITCLTITCFKPYLYFTLITSIWPRFSHQWV